MPKQSRPIPARRQDRPHDDQSIFLRSAESLGRVIGSLQRQLDQRTGRLTRAAAAAAEFLPEDVGEAIANGAKTTTTGARPVKRRKVVKKAQAARPSAARPARQRAAAATTRKKPAAARTRKASASSKRVAAPKTGRSR